MLVPLPLAPNYPLSPAQPHGNQSDQWYQGTSDQFIHRSIVVYGGQGGKGGREQGKKGWEEGVSEATGVEKEGDGKEKMRRR